jgi:sortase A
LSASVPPGQKGVSVIGGHRDTHFEFLQNVVAGDQFLVEQVDGSLTTFRVSEIYITDVRHSRIALDAAVPKIALVACYPFVDWQAGSPLRYLVIAEAASQKLEPVPPTSAEMLTTISL